MQILSTKTETKKLQSRRNLFGLGVTSLIAACSGAAADGTGGGGETEEERIAREAREQEARADALPFKAKELTGDKAGNYAAGIDSASDLTVTVNKPAPAETATLTFSNGAATDANAGIYRLTPNLRQYDLVISAPNIDKIPPNTNPEAVKGRIFIYWDVAKVANKDSTPDLEIKGAMIADNIGIGTPEFLQIGGSAEETKYDMVIRSQNVNKSGTNHEGAIYILWDVTDYTGNKTIDLNSANISNAAPTDEGATSGSLAIHGARPADAIGISAPEFLQIGGEADNYDMVIGSEWVDKPDGTKNEGAIYILWDVNDYENKNQSIDLAAGASSGLLTIYGAYMVDDRESEDNKQGLGNDVHNILYKTAADKSKTLTDIDGDKKIDIAFTDKNYTYVFFGNQIAANNDEGTKVLSKTIDLAKIAALDLSMSENKGYFKYEFNSTDTDIRDDGAAMPITVANKEQATGYRFADNAHTTLDNIKGSTPFAGLSDADADLGVWDIA